MTQDTRKDQRANLDSLIVRYKSATVDEFIENHSHDVSAGGIFVKTTTPFAAGTLLKFEIRIEGDQSVIAGVGRVVWKRDSGDGERPAGMGVKFIKIDDPSKVLIRTLVEKKGSTGAAFEEGEAAKPAAAAPAPAPTPAAAVKAPSAPPPAAPAEAVKAPSAPPPAAAAEAPAVPVPAARSTFASRKSTMMGMGAIALPTPGDSAAPPAVAPREKPKKPEGLFNVPSAESYTEHEPTVMKQAAELLAEALREAGGSMDEVGQNPLFTGSSKASATVETAPEPAPATAQSPQASAPSTLEEPSLDSAQPSTLSAPEPPKAPSEPPPAKVAAPVVAKAEPVSPRDAALKTKPSVGAALAEANAAPAPEEEKGGGSTWIVATLVLLVAVAGVAAWKMNLFGAPQMVDEPLPPPAVTVEPSVQPATPPAVEPTAVPEAVEPAPSAAEPTPSASTTAAAPSATATTEPAKPAKPVYKPATKPKDDAPAVEPAAPPSAPATTATTAPTTTATGPAPSSTTPALKPTATQPTDDLL